MSENPSLVGQVISGCEILQKTAEGGMGSVYKARHKALNKIVCLKILSPALAKDKKAVELFLTEARAIAELDHPNIVNVYNVGKESGYYFIVMSYIEGQTLSALLKKSKILQVGTVLDLFDGVLQGLAAAHEKGIIHRDIKPSNILITPQGQAKLVDFGIAKKVDKTGSTKTTELAGTAYFIAPEQALGKNIDTRADLYSIGASLYYVLTGKFPYRGKNTIEIIQQHINDPVPDPSALRKDLPAWLVLAIQKLMSKNPDDRFQSAKEVYMHFRKMRAEDQLRVKTGNAGRTINLGEEGPLAVSDENIPTHRLTLQRALNKSVTSSSTQPTFSRSLLPSINADSVQEPAKPTSNKPSAMPDVSMDNAAEVKPVDVFVPIHKKYHQKQGLWEVLVLNNLKKLGMLLLFAPLYTLFAGIVVYAFYLLGHTCSVHVSTASSVVHNIVTPFFASTYAPNQLLLTGLCLIVLTLIFASSVIKIFAHTTTTLLAIAFMSFLAGLFTPEVPFMELKQAGSFLFSPEYYLCYLIMAVVWVISICWKLNRSACQGILGAALVVFSLCMTFLACHLSIAPNDQDLLFTILFYASILGGVGTGYYLISRSYKDSILLPFCLFLFAVMGVWSYMVSGLATDVSKTLQVLVANVPVESTASANAAARLEESLHLEDQRKVFYKFDRSNEFSLISNEEAAKQLEPRIEKVAPNTFDETTLPLFARLLAMYYQGGKQKMKLGTWEYAMTFPIHNFNQNAKNNNAYFFLIILLYVFGLVSCSGRIFFGEDL